jgi:hypothetical protein
MGIFNQDPTINRCPLNAAAIQDALNDRTKNALSCHATEEQLEEKISDILQSIYYGVKAGGAPFDRKWRIDVREFGIKYLPDVFYVQPQNAPILSEHSRILSYVKKRFEEAGFIYEDDESARGQITTIYLSLPYDFDESYEWLKAQQVFAKTIASNLVPIVPMAPPSPLLYVPNILSCDALDDTARYYN